MNTRFVAGISSGGTCLALPCRCRIKLRAPLIAQLIVSAGLCATRAAGITQLE